MVLWDSSPEKDVQEEREKSRAFPRMIKRNLLI
jgi:hypothetical protein